MFEDKMNFGLKMTSEAVKTEHSLALKFPKVLF